MKKGKDEMRIEYNRSDFMTLERGKFYKEAVKGSSVVYAKSSDSQGISKFTGSLMGLSLACCRLQSRQPE